jgi:hypothetical protein
MSYPPEGISPIYRKKGAYIHPLYSPSGKVLTNIRPEDHYHHFGIWAPWTRTIFEGREVDFWNLGAGQGIVRHSAILSSWSGPVSAGFRVYHEYIDFTPPGADKTALNETWKVSAFSVKLDRRPVWMVDFLITLNCATDSTLEFLQYRYGGGITYRATADWNRKNLSLLTSEGKTRGDADGSRARWCMIQGVNTPGDTSALVFFSHPQNREHPEPMRVWPEDAVNGRGDLMFEFCPIRHNAWTLEPGREYVLKYRLLIFDGTLDTLTIDNMWYYYAHPPNPQITYVN